MRSNIDSMFEIISDLQEQRSRFAVVYAGRDSERSKRYLTESRILENLLKTLNGERHFVERHPVEQTARSRLNWTALIVEAFGAPTATIYISKAAASCAWHAFTEMHEDEGYPDINCEIASVNLDRLSSKLLWSSSPRTAFAVIGEVGRNYSVSLHDTLEEAESMVEQEMEEAAHEYEIYNASCRWSVVALPRIEFESSE